MSFKLVNNSIPQGNTTAPKKGFMQSVGGSLINIGTTIGAGACVGGGIGKLASLTPYKPNAAALENQFIEMFTTATRADEAPKYIKNAGDEFIKLFKQGRETFVYNKETEAAVNKLFSISEVIDRLDNVKAGSYSKAKSEKIISGFQDFAKKILKIDSDKPLTLEQMQKGLNKEHGKLIDFINNRKAPFDPEKLKRAFAEKAGSSDEIKELATKGAKHLRNKTVIGVGIAAGVIGALALNILNTYGLLKIKLPKGLVNKLNKNKQQQNITPEMLAQLQQAQSLNQGQKPNIGTTQG